MPPTRIQLRRTKGWRLPLQAVKVDRSTIWGNPFRITSDTSAAECVARFARLLEGGHEDEFTAEELARAALIRRRLPELAGKDLACWCALDAPCHAEVLLRMAKG
jgi:hypothetical protein